MTILEILSLLGTIATLVKQYGPSAIHLLDFVPQLIKDGQFIYESALSGTPLTEEKRAEIRANFEAANEASKTAEAKFLAEYAKLIEEAK